jgi:hypothetical protein
MRNLALALALLAPAAVAPAEDADPGYVLHEWGTFTTLAGSDGVLLEGIAADDHALPPFVHSRETTPDGYWDVRLKMETPVLYLYSDREREVRVRVDFPGGILTTWYPQVRHSGPALVPAGGKEPPALKDGFLDWGLVKVLAPGLGGEHLPEVAPGDPWALARVPDANVLRMCREGLEHEKYLFYRGLGRMELSLKASLVDGKVSVEGAKSGRVIQVEGGKVRTAPLGKEPREIAIDDLVRTLAEEYACEGLTHPEALAMVRTWRKSWLETPGTRVLVPLPREETERLLPLQVQPAPRESVRVLVARLDILTPAEEKRAEAVALSAAGAADAAEKLGRFAGPILRRVERVSKDPDAVRRAGELARALEPRR